MKALRNLIILGILGWIGWSLLLQHEPGDRPPILISNGPVRIEVQPEGKGAGDFQKGLFDIGRSWYHHHPAHGPTHFEVIVTDSTCGPEAKYDATELSLLSGGSGTSSTITISISGAGPLTYLEVDPDNGTTVTRAAPARLEVGSREDQLQQVRLAGTTCGFTPGQGSIAINQRQ